MSTQPTHHTQAQLDEARALCEAWATSLDPDRAETLAYWAITLLMPLVDTGHEQAQQLHDRLLSQWANTTTAGQAGEWIHPNIREHAS